MRTPRSGHRRPPRPGGVRPSPYRDDRRASPMLTRTGSRASATGSPTTSTCIGVHAALHGNILIVDHGPLLLEWLRVVGAVADRIVANLVDEMTPDPDTRQSEPGWPPQWRLPCGNLHCPRTEQVGLFESRAKIRVVGHQNPNIILTTHRHHDEVERELYVDPLLLRFRLWIVRWVPERPRGHVYERKLPPCVDLTRSRAVSLGISGTVGHSTIHADLMQDALLIVTHPNDEVAKRVGLDLTIPVRRGRVVVEYATGATIDVLVVDEHHQAFRHKKSPPVQATWTRTAGKFGPYYTSEHKHEARCQRTPGCRMEEIALRGVAEPLNERSGPEAQTDGPRAASLAAATLIGGRGPPPRAKTGSPVARRTLRADQCRCAVRWSGPARCGTVCGKRHDGTEFGRHHPR